MSDDDTNSLVIERYRATYSLYRELKPCLRLPFLRFISPAAGDNFAANQHLDIGFILAVIAIASADDAE